ncbi:TIGR03089 family protein [Longispora sp. NPDC051575]|uniref:TIGR03089 family protein n=1 Tax=Longispora sp. NPDC051575 TaxID=3154943 RepID=UPI00344AF7A3
MTIRTPAGLLAAALAADPARPLLTFYDDSTGERTELSAVTLDNWVSKTANLLVDGHGLGHGDTAAVALPPHWQTAAVLLGCWRAGLSVSHHVGEQVDIAFSAADRFEEQNSPEVYGLSLAPMAMPLRNPPEGVLDYVLEVRNFGDFYGGPAADPDAPGLVHLPGGAEVTHAGLVERARDRAAELGLTGDDRVLVAAPSRPLDWLLAPLAAGASIVLCKDADESKLESRAASEKVTRAL